MARGAMLLCTWYMLLTQQVERDTTTLLHSEGACMSSYRKRVENTIGPKMLEY